MNLSVYKNAQSCHVRYCRDMCLQQYFFEIIRINQYYITGLVGLLLSINIPHKYVNFAYSYLLI